MQQVKTIPLLYDDDKSKEHLNSQVKVIRLINIKLLFMLTLPVDPSGTRQEICIRDHIQMYWLYLYVSHSRCYFIDIFKAYSVIIRIFSSLNSSIYFKINVIVFYLFIYFVSSKIGL